MNSFENKVLEYIRVTSLLDSSGVVIGLSGGPDSVALFKFFLALRDENIYGGSINAVHVNHNLRPGDCDADEAFVRKLCAENNVSLTVENADIAKLSAELHRTEEETGRIVRYKAFSVRVRELINEQPGRYLIAVAHHADDLAETFAMNLFRGSGLEGLTGIKAEQSNVIRPFLCVTKAEIMEYLGDTPYCTDNTNLENDHTRNVWRNKLFPAIAEVSVKKPTDAIRDTAGLLAVDSEFIAQETYGAFEACKVPLGSGRGADSGREMLALSITKLMTYHRAITSRVIRHLYLYVAGSLKDFEQVNLNRCIDLISGELQGDRASMPFGITAMKIGGVFLFAKDEEEIARASDLVTVAEGFVTAEEGFSVAVTKDDIKKGFSAELPDSLFKIRVYIIEKCEELSYNSLSWFCPLELIGDGLEIRNGIGSLNFKKAGAEGSKQIRRIFTDLKVPKDSRDRIIGVTDADGALFVPGVGHSRGFISGKSRGRLEETGCGTEKVVAVIFEERQ